MRSRIRRRFQPVAGTGGVTVPPAGAGARPSAGRGSSTGKRRPAKAATGSESPLTTTITKIVDVVPLPVRIAIGTLLLLAAALAVRSWLSAIRTRRLEQQREELLGDVGLLQQALLPVVPANIGPVTTSVAYRPADGPAAGGDFYDVFPLAEGQVAIVVGDLSGHGRQALQHTALMRFTLRAYLEAGLSPRDTLKTAGAVLERQLGGSLATVVIATFRPQGRTLTYSSAGHPPPLVLGLQPGAAKQPDAPKRPGASGRQPSFSTCISPVIAVSSPLIGAGMKTGIRETTISIPGAAQICFYTDGVTDARVGQELFGERRLERALSQLGAQASAQRLVDRVASEADARPDDMAACLLSIDGGAQTPRTMREQLAIEDGSGKGAAACAERFLLACGVDRDAVDEALGSLRKRTGVTLLQVDLSGAAPKVALRPDNVTSLQALDARRAVARVSL